MKIIINKFMTIDKVYFKYIATKENSKVIHGLTGIIILMLPVSY